MINVLVLNGPNLNLLGKREPDLYGATTLAQVHAGLEQLAGELGLSVSCRQSNAEHELVDWIQRADEEGFAWIVINPAAYTHTSVALRDALLAVGKPFIEVHLSNVYRREEFRRRSYFSDVAAGVIAGLGPGGYQAALRHIAAQAGGSGQPEKE